MIKRVLWMAFCVSFVFALGAVDIQAGDADQEPIGKISMFEINDLSGPTSDATVPHHNGLRDVIKHANDNGGIVYKDPKTGKTERAIIQFKYADNKASPAPVPTQYERLMGMSPTPILYMPGSSGAAEPSQKWIKRDKVVTYGLPAGVKTWSAPDGWYYLVFPDYPAQACLAAKWAIEDWKSKGHTEKPKWAWFTLDLPFGRAPITPESENYIKNLGFDIVGLWTMPFTPVDLSAELRAIQSKGANYIYGNLITLQTQAVLKTISRLGLKGKIQPLGMTGGLVEEAIDICGKDVIEDYVAVRYTAMIDEVQKPGVKLAKELADKNKRYYGTDYMEGVALGLLATNTLKTALEKHGYPITGEQLKVVWEDPKGMDTGGIIDELVFSAKERRGVKKAHLATAKDGKIVRITDDTELPDMRPGGPWTPK